MNKTALFLSVLFFIYPFLLQAQAPAIDWQKCYGSGNYDNASSLAVTSDGGSIFVGITYGDGGDVSGHQAASIR
ncbi:MAG TPA: hypothetical protein VGN00_29630 [Puia sp.]|jgi:hypothetical protein